MEQTSTISIESSVPKAAKIVAVILLVLGILIGLGVIIKALSQSPTISSVFGLITAAGLIASYFGLIKLKDWGLYLLAAVAALLAIIGISLAVSGQSTNGTGVFALLLIYILALIYFWRAYKKSGGWMGIIAVIAVLSVIILIYPKKTPVLVSAKSQPVTSGAGSKTINIPKLTGPMNVSNSEAGFKFFMPNNCKINYYVKKDSVHDPDIFTCQQDKMTFQIFIKNTGQDPKSINDVFNNMKQTATKNGATVTDNKDFTYDAGNGKTVTGKQMKETFTQKNTPMKEWVILLPSDSKNAIIEFIYVTSAANYDSNSKEASDILNAWQVN